MGLQLTESTVVIAATTSQQPQKSAKMPILGKNFKIKDFENFFKNGFKEAIFRHSREKILFSRDEIFDRVRDLFSRAGQKIAFLRFQNRF